MYRLLFPVFSHYDGAGYFVHPNIPGQKESAMRESLGISEDETIYALLDSTLLGNGKAGIVFTNEGFYWLNPGALRGVTHLSWEGLFKTHVLFDQEGNFVQVGMVGTITPPLRPGLVVMTPFRVFHLLQDLRQALNLAQQHGVLEKIWQEKEGLEQANEAWTLSHKGERIGPFDLTLAARMIVSGRIPLNGSLAKQEQMTRFEPVKKCTELMREVDRLQREEPQRPPGLLSQQAVEYQDPFGKTPDGWTPPQPEPSISKNDPAKQDLNKINLSALLVIPGMNQEMASFLLRERHKREGFESVEEAINLLNIPPHQRVKIKKKFFLPNQTISKKSTNPPQSASTVPPLSEVPFEEFEIRVVD